MAAETLIFRKDRTEALLRVSLPRSNMPNMIFAWRYMYTPTCTCTCTQPDQSLDDTKCGSGHETTKEEFASKLGLGATKHAARPREWTGSYSIVKYKITPPSAAHSVSVSAHRYIFRTAYCAGTRYSAIQRALHVRPAQHPLKLPFETNTITTQPIYTTQIITKNAAQKKDPGGKNGGPIAFRPHLGRCRIPAFLPKTT